MSYGSRSMSPKDDLLFRVKVWHEAFEHEVDDRKYVDGRFVKVGTKIQKAGEFLSYTGPYTNVSVARRAATKERNNMSNSVLYTTNNVKWTVELEACLPEWKVVE